MLNIAVYDSRVLVFCDAVKFAAIIEMNMTVEEIFRAVLIKQLVEDCKSHMRKILTVAELVGWGMSHENIYSLAAPKPEFQFFYTASHLTLREHIRTVLVSHRASKTENAYSVEFVYFIFDADAALRHGSFGFTVMVAVYIEHGRVSKGGNE